LNYWVYILQSEVTGRYYIGSTGDLDDRLRRHNGGRSKSTKSGAPWKVVYTEVHGGRSEAISRERELKSWKSRVKLEKLIKEI
jgi:putative endonuclease